MTSSPDRIGEAARSAPFGLHHFTRPRSAAQPCDLCGSSIPPEHRHMINPAERRIMCACSACLILLSGGPGSKFRQIPMRVEVWSDFRLDDAQWQALGIPIQLAFFFRSTPMDRVVAVYPGAAGAIESLPPEQSWNELVSANQRMLKLEPDTEALLINRLRGASEAYRAPIDECYALCGLISTSWHGLSGGAEVWDAVKSFFRDLRRRAELAESNDG